MDGWEAKRSGEGKRSRRKDEVKYISYAWIVIRNLIVLGIAIAIFGKAGNDYEKIVFSLLVLIYLSVSWSMTWHQMMTSASILALGKEFWNIRKLLTRKNISNTTLNAVFSEEEIARKKQASEKWGRDVERLFDRVYKKEREEIKAHHEAGKDKSSFEPSTALLNILREESLAITCRDVAWEDYEKMIKANLAVLNGRAIEEVREGCELNFDFIALHGKTYEYQEEHVKNRKNYWETSWDSILESKLPRSRAAGH